MLSTSDVPIMTKNKFYRDPVITSDGGGDRAAISLEGGTDVTTVTASQHGNGRFFFSIDGPDAGLFTINSKTGSLRFLSDPNAGVYSVVVTATGRGGLTDTQAITVTVAAGGLSPVYYLDFVNTTYEHNGSPIALGDVIEHNADLGPFDPGTDINAFGLSPPPSMVEGVFTSPAFVQFVAASLLASGLTAVFNLSFTGTSPIGSITVQAVRLPDFEADLGFSATDSGGALTLLERYDDPDTDFAGDMNIGLGNHRIAWTVRSDLSQSISVDGGSVVTLAAFTPSPTLSDLYLTVQTSSNEENAKRSAITDITIYAAQLDADLPAMSDLP